MARFSSIVILSAALLSAAPVYAQSDGHSPEDIAKCREFGDEQARLACYDRIGEAVSEDKEPSEPSEDGAAKPETGIAEVESGDSEYSELTEETGLPRSADANKPIPVTISSCGEATNFKFYFYFDNGQVWRYIGGKKLRYRSCDGPAILVEDRLGFALQLNGDGAWLRVKRIK